MPDVTGPGDVVERYKQLPRTPRLSETSTTQDVSASARALAEAAAVGLVVPWGPDGADGDGD